MRLIITFKQGQYSPIKDEFKALYSSVFKWDKVKGWRSKKGFVEATEKMEPGVSPTFRVECDENMAKKITDFCNDELHKIEYVKVESFTDAKIVPQMLPAETVEPKIRKIVLSNPDELPWMNFTYHHNHWEYRKEQLINEWDPDFRVNWK